MSAFESLPVAEVSDPLTGEITEVLYCLFCGYNLRGLSGNPARCPECGGFNDRSLIAIPAEFIRSALLKMETAPTTCVGVSVIALLISCPLLAMGEFVAIAVICIGSGLVWLLPYWYMRSVFENKPGWRSILRDFHLATACWVAGIFLPLFLLLHRGGSGYSIAIKAVCFFTAVGLFPLGMSIYRRGQKQIDILQRHKAVAVTQRYFQRMNSFLPATPTS